MREVIDTDHAPEPIGVYSQAVRFGDLLHVSGQIPLHPETMVLSDSSMEAQVNQVFDNLAAVCSAAGGNLKQVVKLTVYLIDLADVACVNQAMKERFSEPYPARVTIGASALPRGARVEIDAMMACL